MNPFAYGAVVAVIGIVVVFTGMCILIAMLYLMAAIFKSIDKKKKEAAEKAAPVSAPAAPVVPETVEAEPEMDQNELIAVIAAAIAAFDGGDKPLVVKSVRRVSGWKNAARSEQVYKF